MLCIFFSFPFPFFPRIRKQRWALFRLCIYLCQWQGGEGATKEEDED